MVKFNYLKLSGIIAQSGKRQKHIANMVNVHPNTVSNWVNGNNKPDPGQLVTLLTGLGFTADDLKNERLVDWYPVNGSRSE